MNIDIETPINAILAGIGALILVVFTHYVNRHIKRKTAADALEEALRTGEVIASSEPDPVRKAAVVVEYVERVAPDALKTLKIERPDLETKVRQSRSMYFGD